jgi:hypothetical protein
LLTHIGLKVLAWLGLNHFQTTIQSGLRALKYKKELNIGMFLLLIERKPEISKETMEEGLTKP